MDIKTEIEKIINKIKGDKDLLKKFETDPIQAVESILGVDLPDETIKQIVAGVKAGLTADNVKGVLGKLSGLFGK